MGAKQGSMTPSQDESTELFDLSDRVAIITGGAGLLGYYHGAILAAAGAHVVLLDLPAANPQGRAQQLTDEYGSESLGITSGYHQRGLAGGRTSTDSLQNLGVSTFSSTMLPITLKWKTEIPTGQGWRTFR